MELFKTVTQENWGWDSPNWVPTGPVSVSQAGPLTSHSPKSEISPGSSNTSVQMNVQVLCREPGRGLGHPLPLPWATLNSR